MVNWQRKARLVVALGALVFALVVAFAFQTRTSPPDAAPVARADPAALVESAGGLLSRGNRDREEVRIEYGTLLTYADGSVKMEQVTVTTVRAGGRTFTLAGRQAEIGESEGRMLLTGDVRLTASDGLEVRTERATYTEDDGIVRAPGPVRFSRGRMQGSGVGMTFDKNRDAVSILEQVVVDFTPGTPGAMALRVEAGAAEFNRRDNVVRFEGGLKAVRGGGSGETIEAGTGLARLGPEDDAGDLLDAVELRGGARIGGQGRGIGAFQAMKGRDIDLRYGTDGQTLEYARMIGDAAIEVAGDVGQPGRQITAAELELELAPDGVTPTDLAARGDVELRLPSDGGTARVIRAATLDADGDARQGLTSARFGGGVEFREVGGDLDRRATSRTLDAELTPGLGAIHEAEFGGGVRFVDGATVARAATARYRIDEGVVTLSGARGGTPPNVTRDRVSIDGARIQVTLDGPLIDAAGAVRSALQPQKAAGAAGSRVQVPSMLKEDQAVNVSADRVVYDGRAASATYTGSAQLWQAETTIKGDTIVVNEATGDLTARGTPVATTAVLMQPAPTDGTERVRTLASARAGEFLYEESRRRATYVDKAFVSGPQGDVRGDKIELYLLPSGDELERAEAYDNVTLEEGTRRRASGARMTYFAADERYLMTGAPVTIVDECGRETTGGTLTFYRTDDRVVVDGGPVRSRTKGGGNCP